MGVYDILPKGGQLKCWDSEGNRLNVGDKVGAYYPEYIVLVQEGGFVRVKNGVITEIVEDKRPRYPEEFAPTPCIDKWGQPAESSQDLEGRCMFGYHYYFAHEEDSNRNGNK